MTPGRKTKPELRAVFEVGGRSVAGAVLSTRQGQLPEILFAERIYLDQRKKATTSLEETITVLTSLAEKVYLTAQHHSSWRQRWFRGDLFKEVICVIAQPWYQNEVITLHRQDPTGFTLTEHKLQQLLVREFRNLKNKNHSDPAVVLLEQEVIDTKLNGYPAPDPIGQTASEVEITAYQSTVSRAFYQKISRALKQTVFSKRIIFQSYAQVGYQVTNLMFPGVPNWIYLDVTGYGSEVLVVQNNRIAHAGSFDEGNSDHLRSLASLLELPEAIAESYLKTFNQYQLKPDFQHQIKQFSKQCLSSWRAAVSSELSQVAAGPKSYKLVLASSALWNSLLTEELEAISGSDLPVKLEVTTLTPEVLAQYCQWSRKHSFDVFLALDAIYIDHRLNIT